MAKTQEERKAETRSRILDGALDCFARHGYHQTTVSEIADVSNTSKGAVYFHFDRKETIFLALMDELGNLLFGRVERALDTADGAVTKVGAALEAALRTFADHPQLTQISLIEASVVGQVSRKKQEELRALFTNAVKHNIKELIADGDIEPVNVSIVSNALLGGIERVVQQWMADPEAEDLDTLIPEVVRFGRRAIGF